jgi:tRNA pseudouridine38-40 synthase
MPRYKLTLEYDGTPFVGWQMQENGASVQGRLAEAVRSFSGEEVVPRGAGRTDAGVHALGQVAHFDLLKDWPDDKVRDALNAVLRPDPISVLACEHVASGFDARFGAKARHYLYRIIDRRSPLALERMRAWGVFRPLDAKAMDEAAQVLVGHHDFTTFRSTECQAESPEKTLDKLTASRHGEIIRVEASARSFLHNQVRSMVGSLKLVGEGKWSAADLQAALAAKDQARCGPVAPSRPLPRQSRLLIDPSDPVGVAASPGKDPRATLRGFLLPRGLRTIGAGGFFLRMRSMSPSRIIDPTTAAEAATRIRKAAMNRLLATSMSRIAYHKP